MHKRYADKGSDKARRQAGYFRITVRADHIIFVEPIGSFTAGIIEHELSRLRQVTDEVKQAGHRVLILVNISGITKHTSGSRTALKAAAKLPFERGAAYGGSRLLGMIMQYLQRSIDPKRAHYFRTEAEAVAYLQGKNARRRPGYRSASRSFVMVSAVLLLFLSAATYLSWQSSRQKVRTESFSLFDQIAQRTHNDLQKRMGAYIQALYGFRGLFNASHSVERNEFSAYFKSLNLSSDFPGFSAISYIKYVKSQDVSAFTSAVRMDKSLNSAGYPNFAIYPFTKKPAYDVVDYTEPNENSAPGFDLSSDPTRLATLTEARDTGQPVATESVTFASAPKTQGFFVTLPVYFQPAPATMAARQAQLEGYVNAVFQYPTLFKNALAGLDETGVAVKIYDDQDRMIYRSGKPVAGGQTVTKQLTVGTRTFDVSFNVPAAYGLDRAAQQLPGTVLSGGIFAVFMLSLLLVTLLRSRGQAIKLADTITADLEHERNIAIDNQHKLEISERALADEKASVERKVVERTRELNEARAQLEASLRGLPFGFAIINRGHKDVFSNQALSTVVGRDIPIRQASRDTVKHLHAALKNSLDVKACLKQAESTLKIVDQECMLGSKYLHVLFIPIVDKQAGGQPVVGSVIILEDVTEERALQRSRDEFFSIASHELRTPLTAVRGNASIILEDYREHLRDPALKQMVTDIESSSARLITIVNNLLDMSELEQNQAVIAKATIEVKPLLAAVMDDFKTQADKQGVALKLKAGKEQMIVTADNGRLKQIIHNLISNALHFTHSGSVSIAVQPRGGYAKISVADTGKGIPVELQHLLFRKLQQASQNILTRDTSQSTGLGLYLSRLLAERMGGTLTLEKSEPGKGSVFVLELPLSKTAVPAEKTK